MSRTEELNIRITQGEKEALAAAAKKSNLKVSDYVRKRLLGSELADVDQVLLVGLAAFAPHLKAALARIDANMQEISRLRDHRTAGKVGSTNLY